MTVAVVRAPSSTSLAAHTFMLVHFLRVCGGRLLVRAAWCSPWLRSGTVAECSSVATRHGHDERVLEPQCALQWIPLSKECESNELSHCLVFPAATLCCAHVAASPPSATASASAST